MRRLPSLNALRVFECAARHESFTKAGEELLLTQSAVSKQVVRLETELGQQLFIRSHRKVTLTEAGQLVMQAVNASFAGLRHRLDEITIQRPKHLHIVADADFAQQWLFPRLPGFDAAHPDRRLILQSESSLTEPPEMPYDCDCAVLWGRGDWQNCRVEPLFANSVFPVAAPGFFDSDGGQPNLSDLQSNMLIHDRSSYWWRTILSSANVRIKPDDGRTYSSTTLCLEAAARGDGVAIGDEVTTRAYLETGKLVLPFRIRRPSPDAYFLLLPATDTGNPTVEAFASWLVSQAAAHSRWFSDFWN
ncbi:LysR family transcriptional regulator [Leisingera daeponensis]|uniref:LysR family transcriptional regulator n=1 Tax=Leisingera daeponensis TaxID=405746 RepID=A0ABS7NLU3_9RHOB|nr:LysR substrate-binding domain-containing protein [Leisingera daeponensis]MBY6142160.1 LysR family transcriptional regulator [Leisingera daeponensis]